jgi:hypothetical protein
MRDLAHSSFTYTFYSRLYGDRANFVYGGRARALASHANSTSLPFTVHVKSPSAFVEGARRSLAGVAQLQR